MSKLFEVDIRVSTHKTLEVEAETQEEAFKKAERAWAEESVEYQAATITDEQVDVLDATAQYDIPDEG